MAKQRKKQHHFFKVGRLPTSDFGVFEVESVFTQLVFVGTKRACDQYAKEANRTGTKPISPKERGDD